MKLAGESGELAKKKEAYEMWKLQERYGLEFDADQIFCNGCRTDKELGAAVSHCEVRKCAIEKDLISCVVCSELTTCDKGLWKRYPEFYQSVIQLQDRYRAAAKAS
jgi:hypothetical protein